MASGIGFRKPRARATINQAVSAVLQEHRRAQLPLDRKHPYSEAWRGISRVKAKTDNVRKAKPVLGADLAAMLDVMGNRPIDIRDKALLAMGWAKRSELVGLDWMVKGAGQGHVVVDTQAITMPRPRRRRTRRRRSSFRWMP
jgi:site-specific recombinase XerC